ncbi:alpha-L-fucosidase [Sporosarcina sp. G11-34]|uniref:alpha-L-fucosidase n=1 Tax=Sporosarcina sp. G11-34 TaxID=2849605 RepID=UPI0022A9A33A|nr:alpha-L-fucosidase [Sporosarcina sp. G11-34]MCZ2258502.1 alpha-L-fucosidase [Sporosarcina sp. G11-34]
MNRKTKSLSELNQNGISGIIELSNEENIAAWQRLQYGMFIHWGLYSEIGGVWNEKPVKKGYSEQIQMWANISKEEYMKVAKNFTAEKFNPVEICTLAKEAGMEYIVITSKHHDGFTMFDTATTDYGIIQRTPYGKDPLKLLANECHRQGLKFGVYFSLIDWNEGHDFDENNNNPIPESMEVMIAAQLRELMTNYGPIAEVWFDMSCPTQAQSVKFAEIIHELQPKAIVSGRVWNNNGDFRTLADNQVPSNTLDGAWQTPASIYHATWGYRSWQDRSDISGKVRDLVKGLTSVRARGGNYLLNIGPRGDGSMVEFESDVLREMGKWLDRHPGAILGASGTKFGGQSWGEVTVNDKSIFLNILKWPVGKELTLPGLVTGVQKVIEDGASDELDWRMEGNNLIVTLPDIPLDTVLPVIRVELSGELRLIPERTIVVNENNTWTIQSQDIYRGRSYSDKGNYSSLIETTVKKTAYLSTKEGGTVLLRIQGEVSNQDTLYKVEFGTEFQVVTGRQLIETEVGPIIVLANEIVPLTITLVEPKHANEDIGLAINTAFVKLKKEVLA